MLKAMAMFCTYFRQLIPINTALEISLHGTGSRTIHVSACALEMHTTRLIIEAVYAHVSISVRHPRNLAALELSLHGIAP